MISYQTALAAVLEHAQDYGEEIVDLKASTQRILAEPIFADRDFPPFDRATKDGIAIHSKALSDGISHFEIEGIAQAGSPQLELQDKNNCIEVMTGAMIPKNADTVIMYEHLEKTATGFQLPKSAEKGQNVHYQGSDVVQGAALLEPNITLTAAEIGVMASVGKQQVLAKTLPKVAVISTGNELVEVAEVPLPYQIRKSNSYSLQSLLETTGILSEAYHLIDDKEIIERRLADYLQQYDVLLLSGGVSKGKFDFLPETFEKLGVEKVFHKVLQRPGKPFWFGKHKIHKTLIFAFPGNPVSTFANYHLYFIPWLNKTLGTHTPQFSVFLKESLENNTQLTLFKGVRLSLEAGKLVAKEIKTTGSGDVAGLTKIDGFIRLPPQSVTEKDNLVPFYPTRKLI